MALTGADNRKSVAGSVALVGAAVVTSAGLLGWLQRTGCLDVALPGDLWLRLCVISCVAAVVELITVADDNYTVPSTAGFLSLFLLG